MIVKLPNHDIIMNTKAPFSAYLEALEAPDEATGRRGYKDHARQNAASTFLPGLQGVVRTVRPAPVGRPGTPRRDVLGRALERVPARRIRSPPSV